MERGTGSVISVSRSGLTWLPVVASGGSIQGRMPARRCQFWRSTLGRRGPGVRLQVIVFMSKSK